MLGKIAAALLSIYLAFKFSVPIAIKLEKEDELRNEKYKDYKNVANG